MLPAAGATKSARQVASLTAFNSRKSEVAHNVTSHPQKIGTELKYDCPVYRNTPNVCQHAIASAKDIGILLD